jgi:hypothetical protein
MTKYIVTVHTAPDLGKFEQEALSGTQARQTVAGKPEVRLKFKGLTIAQIASLCSAVESTNMSYWEGRKKYGKVLI